MKRSTLTFKERTEIINKLAEEPTMAAKVKVEFVLGSMWPINLRIESSVMSSGALCALTRREARKLITLLIGAVMDDESGGVEVPDILATPRRNAECQE